MKHLLWLTWRQHRLAALSSAAVTAALAASLLTLSRTDYTAWPEPQSTLTWAAMLMLPCLAGMFIGVPLFAGELENGTHRLALTQSVTRAGLLVPRLVLVFGPLVAAGGLLGWLGLQTYAHAGWIMRFDHQAPVFVAYVAYGLALGIATGAVVGRTLPAVIVTFLGYVVIRGWIEGHARLHYMPLLARPVGASSTVVLGRNDDLLVSMVGNMRTGARYELYQPAVRFWTFQSIETAIFVALTAVLLGLTVYWVLRRVG